MGFQVGTGGFCDGGRSALHSICLAWLDSQGGRDMCRRGQIRS